MQAPPRAAPLTFDKAFLSQLWQILRAHLSPEDDAAHGDLVEMVSRLSCRVGKMQAESSR